MSITIRAGRPGFGKTYTCVDEIVAKLKEGRTVYTNFPVKFEYQGEWYSSLVWESWMVLEVILDADVYVDEAYRDYDSTDKDAVDQDIHTFFATNRHNDVNLTLIAQNVARISKKIREIAEYEYVKKTEIPFVLWLPYVLLVRFLMARGVNPLKYDKPPRAKYPRPLWFTIFTYENEAKAQAGDVKDVECVTRVLFRTEVAKAYDTHYFRKNAEPYQSVTWLDYLDNLVPVPHKPVTGPRDIKSPSDLMD